MEHPYRSSQDDTGKKHKCEATSQAKELNQQVNKHKMIRDSMCACQQNKAHKKVYNKVKSRKMKKYLFECVGKDITEIVCHI